MYIISLHTGRLGGIQAEITVPSVPSSKSLSIPVITRLIVSMYSIKIVYIEEIVKLSQGHLGQVYNFE